MLVMVIMRDKDVVSTLLKKSLFSHGAQGNAGIKDRLSLLLNNCMQRQGDPKSASMLSAACRAVHQRLVQEDYKDVPDRWSTARMKRIFDPSDDDLAFIAYCSCYVGDSIIFNDLIGRMGYLIPPFMQTFATVLAPKVLTDFEQSLSTLGTKNDGPWQKLLNAVIFEQTWRLRCSEPSAYAALPIVERWSDTFFERASQHGAMGEDDGVSLAVWAKNRRAPVLRQSVLPLLERVQPRPQFVIGFLAESQRQPGTAWGERLDHLEFTRLLSRALHQLSPPVTTSASNPATVCDPREPAPLWARDLDWRNWSTLLDVTLLTQEWGLAGLLIETLTSYVLDLARSAPDIHPSFTLPFLGVTSWISSRGIQNPNHFFPTLSKCYRRLLRSCINHYLGESPPGIDNSMESLNCDCEICYEVNDFLEDAEETVLKLVDMCKQDRFHLHQQLDDTDCTHETSHAGDIVLVIRKPVATGANDFKAWQTRQELLERYLQPGVFMDHAFLRMILGAAYEDAVSMEVIDTDRHQDHSHASGDVQSTTSKMAPPIALPAAVIPAKRRFEEELDVVDLTGT
ncbi:hypothetical protein KVT40_004962 [Elsinoe batatas]|uniref:Uncharacterized protein n=1 Tax=Elsinoe batatas TaxID=2601811 RepID=A0A8K0PJ87_9PEZI|nr:hypothetical protein KVT40_004962 [Elsinoe batatas]